MRVKMVLVVLALVLVCGLPLRLYADCPGDCVKTCSAGPAEDYVTCLDNCLAGCTPDPVPPVPPPTPVPDPPKEPEPAPAPEPAKPDPTPQPDPQPQQPDTDQQKG